VLLILFALLAIADGIYLTLVHLDYETGHKGVSMVCHALTDAGCSVTAGRFGALGGIPVATIGFAGTVTMLVIGTAALFRRDRWEDPHRSVLLLLAVASILASIVMGTLSTLEGSWCPFCVIWYGLTFVLLLTAWMARDRGLGVRDVFDDALGSAGLLAMAVFCVVLIAATLAHNQRRESLVEQRDADMAEHADEIAASIVAEIVAQPPIAFEVKGAPTKGPADAPVAIVEFSDFECPHCRRLWESVEAYLPSASHPVQVQFVNFPLDSACNPHVEKIHLRACDAAIAARCAHQQDEFWEYGSLLFEHQGDFERDSLLEYAASLGLDIDAFTTCMADGAVAEQVRADADLGQRLDIAATPTFYVNGYEVKGALPAPIFAAVVEGILAHQSESLGQSSEQ
jgi:protein-disulfide isomerase